MKTFEQVTQSIQAARDQSNKILTTARAEEAGVCSVLVDIVVYAAQVWVSTRDEQTDWCHQIASIYDVINTHQFKAQAFAHMLNVVNNNFESLYRAAEFISTTRPDGYVVNNVADGTINIVATRTQPWYCGSIPINLTADLYDTLPIDSLTDDWKQKYSDMFMERLAVAKLEICDRLEHRKETTDDYLQSLITQIKKLGYQIHVTKDSSIF